MTTINAKDGRMVRVEFHGDTLLTRMTIHSPQAALTADLDYYDVDKLAKALGEMSIAYNEAMDAEITKGLGVMGITPANPMLGWIRPATLEEEMLDVVGERCDTFEPGCPRCDMWEAWDLGAYGHVRAELDDTHAFFADDGGPNPWVKPRTLEAHEPGYDMSREEKQAVAASYGMSFDQMQSLVDIFNPDKTSVDELKSKLWQAGGNEEGD